LKKRFDDLRKLKSEIQKSILLEKLMIAQKILFLNAEIFKNE
jgi:hypothetical protein